MGWPGRAQRLICWTVVGRREAKLKEHAMRTSQNAPDTISTIGIDVGKNTFHLVGLDKRGAIVLQQKVTRHQLGRRLGNPSCNARLGHTSWHGAADPGCPHSRRVLEGKRTRAPAGELAEVCWAVGTN